MVKQTSFLKGFIFILLTALLLHSCDKLEWIKRKVNLDVFPITPEHYLIFDPQTSPQSTRTYETLSKGMFGIVIKQGKKKMLYMDRFSEESDNPTDSVVEVHDIIGAAYSSSAFTDSAVDIHDIIGAALLDMNQDFVQNDRRIKAQIKTQVVLSPEEIYYREDCEGVVTIKRGNRESLEYLRSDIKPGSMRPIGRYQDLQVQINNREEICINRTGSSEKPVCIQNNEQGVILFIENGELVVAYTNCQN